MSSSSQRTLDQGISAYRAGGAQKRPPATSKPQSPSKRQRSNVRPSPSVGSASRRSGDDSTTDSSSVASNVRRRTRDSVSVAAPDEPEWARSDRVLLDRTLRLHTVSPLHFSSLPASIQEVSRPLFQMLKTELHHYINLRLSDGFGFLEAAGPTIDVRDPESGDLRPPERRRRADVDRVGHVRIGFLDDSEFTGALQATNRSGEARAKPWAIEIELGKPAAEQDTSKNKISSLRSKQAQEATSADLCHIVFVPASTTKDDRSRASRRYPLIATKAPSSTSAGADPLLGPAINVGPIVLGHALDWVQKRFDCRISSANGAASIASQLRGPRLEALAELIVRQTRTEMGMVDGEERSQEQRTADAGVKPVELVFAFPLKVRTAGAEGGRTVQQGPAPDLASLTLTVPWEVCMSLLDGLALDEPLLPALNHYLSTHTSIPLDALELTRIGVAGISVGSGRIKISKVPTGGDTAANEARKRSVLKRSLGREGKEDEGEASERRRAGAVFGFLRRIVEGEDEDEDEEEAA
ncbi:uncharacterized protein UTRI_01808 [Ustilago trichophora]|uniref:Uncharacterized protein n=1 Tax=Ustilago trichophora TaxID=86804 RepID=A0A5C3DZP0_9BASI|nr:uncharacterized protein UTRI_01808 [Ustilago trichophora]